MKIYMFDKTGRYVREFENLKEARKVAISKIRTSQMKQSFKNPFITPNCKFFIARNLFRETNTAHGYIFTFEDDERIRKNEQGVIWLDCIDESTKMEDYLTEDIKYKPVERKFDTLKSSDKVILCIRNNIFGDDEILTARTVEDARKKTGAKFIWGALLGENKTSNGWSFKFATI